MENCVFRNLHVSASQPTVEGGVETHGEELVDHSGEWEEKAGGGIQEAETEGEMDKWRFYFHLREGQLEELAPQACARTHTFLCFSKSSNSVDIIVSTKQTDEGFCGCICGTVGELVCLISFLTVLFYSKIITVPLKLLVSHMHMFVCGRVFGKYLKWHLRCLALH